jgi:hypothetical protein
MVHQLRHERDMQRVRRAAEAARRENLPAMAVALAQIGAAFDQAAVVNGFKIRVEHLIGLGAGHPAVRARFSARAAMLAGCDLNAAIARVERWWRDERKAFQVASALGCGTRLSPEILSELRLILRLLRRKRLQTAYEATLAALCAAPLANAAE